jgi:RNA polymerase-binding transcription factor DksA
MTRLEIEKYRTRLAQLNDRLQATVASVEEQACSATGGESVGGLSNAPLHLGDIGSAESEQELGATLLENELYLQREILAAQQRIDQGTFGRCENCGTAITLARLDAIPYARHCHSCAQKLHAGRDVNVNEGRPRSWQEGIGLRADGPPPGAPGGPQEEHPTGDTHGSITLTSVDPGRHARPRSGLA